MRLFTYILRFLLIGGGFIISILAATAFLNAMLMAGVADGDANTQEMHDLFLSIGVPVLSLFVGYYAFFPAMIVFIYAEIKGKRTWVFHGLGGCVIGLAALSRHADASSLANPPIGFLMAVIAAGIVGGIVYWLIAGRNAGKHLDDIAGRIKI